jgi:hypothetical protein
MKVTCLLVLLLTVSCAALMRGTSYAGSSQQTSSQHSVAQDGSRSHDTHEAAHFDPTENVSHEKEGNPTAEPQAYRPISDRNRSRSHARLTAHNRPKQLSNARKRSPGKAPNLHSTGSDKSGSAAKNGLVQNQAVNRATQVRSTSLVQSSGASVNPSPNYARHLGPNPAVVGGTKNTNRTGGLNGTSMHHRP